jgi:hypothetical protein
VRPSKGANTDQWPQSPFEIKGRHRCPRLTETTDQQFEDWHGRGPSKPVDAEDGSTPLLPRTALLIRGSKPEPRRVRTGAPDHQSQGRRGRAHSSLSSSPSARGRPTCRVREPARAASRGDPTEGELPRPRSLANGTEPHLANPCKRFNGRISGPRAYPYRTGHGRPLEPPANSSARNPQSATRSMGVAETSPPVPRRDGEGALKTRQRVRPDRLEWAQARGLVAWLHLLVCTGREQRQSCVCHRSRLRHCRCRLEHVPSPLTRLRDKTLQERPRSCRASGARPAGPLTRPHGRHLQPGGRTSYQ